MTQYAHGTDGELRKRFDVQEVDEDQLNRLRVVREQGYLYSLTLEGLCPPSRELSLAMTNLEQAVFWANKAISRHKETE